MTHSDRGTQSPADRQPKVYDAKSIARSIADAVVVKAGDLFFLTEPNGNVPLDDDHGFGLYSHDCRFLNGYTLELAGAAPTLLASNAARGSSAVFELTNPTIHLPDGSTIPKECIGVEWLRTVDGENNLLHDRLIFQNYSLQAASLPLALTFRARFEDVFAIRSQIPDQPGTQHPPRWQENMLSFLYDGKDGLYRSVTVHFSRRPQTAEDTTAGFQIELPPREQAELELFIRIAESSDPDDVRPQRHARSKPETREQAQQHVDRWLDRHTDVKCDSLVFNRALKRSLRDLYMLRSTLQGDVYFAAGLPWFATLFGRDSLITALQTLACDPQIAEQTLRLLARYQGQQVDDRRDEQPGKILHELRVGELAHLGKIPHTPYYGTVDATLLFLILVGRHAAWTGNLALFDDLRTNVEQALAWIATYGDADGDGYVEYTGSSGQGLSNQGWKDSGDSMVNADGSLATPPIRLVEVQGYVYMVYRLIGDLYARAGDSNRADELRRQAAQLRERFNRDFWLAERGIYAMALQADRSPLAVVSSNPGQALWTGIADDDKARQTADRLMAANMFNGWGIRTLSADERRYNPIGYHLGTVWPHDNSLIVAGLRRYGYDDAAQRVFAGLVEASLSFEHQRLPELFAGFGRAEFAVPVHYPVACHPQAWAAGSIPLMLEALLGLMPEAFDRRLRIVRPVLPKFIEQVELRKLRVGAAHVDLRFTRSASGANVKVLAVDGDLEVVIEPEATHPAGL